MKRCVMTLRHFKIFLCVCDEGNMTAAAGKLYIAQPSVSQAIAELEKHYRVKLFERLGKKLFITIAGQKLISYARHIVNLAQEAEDVMQETYHNGVIRIGASVTIGTCILHEIIRNFSQQYPNIKIISSVNNTAVIEGMLLADQLDIGLVEGKIHSQGMVIQHFMSDDLVLVTSKTHPLGQKDVVQPEDIDNMEFIIREEGSGTRELFEVVMANKGLNWQIAGIYNNAETIKNMVSAGLGIAVMSRLAVQKEIKRKELKIIHITGMYFNRQFIIVHHKNKYIVPGMRSFIQGCLSYKS